MQIHAQQLLTEAGWKTNATVTIGGSGTIHAIDCNTTADAQAIQVDVLLPAVTNLHSHAFQRAMAGMTEQRGPDPTDSFWTWRKLMYAFLDILNPDDIEAIAALVQMEMLEAGFAAVGEFHYLHHQAGGRHYNDCAELALRIVAAASQSGIGLTLLPVLYQQGGCDGRTLVGGQQRFGNSVDSFAKLFNRARDALQQLPADSNIGVAPHSLRAVSRDGLTAALQLAVEKPLHIHVAEQPLEVQEVVQAYGARPVEWLLTEHDVNQRWCLIHCTQMQSHETRALAFSGATVGLCPITESSLGDGIFDARRYVSAGGLLGFGSDSNVRISLAEELRTLEYSQRLRDHSRAVLATEKASTGRVLYELACRGGAQACARTAGVIEVGMLADLVALNNHGPRMMAASGDEILDSFIFAADDQLVTDVWAAGRHLVQDGQHIARGPIVARYCKTLQSLRNRLTG